MTTPSSTDQRDPRTTGRRFSHLLPASPRLGRRAGRLFALAPLALALVFATLLSVSPHTATGASAATYMTLRGTTTFANSQVSLQQWNGSQWVTVQNKASDGSRNFWFVLPRGAYYRVSATKIVTPTGNYCPSSIYAGTTNSFYLGANSVNPTHTAVSMSYWRQAC